MGDYVGLNVGGKIYRTSRLTLTRYPDSFFSSLLDGGIPSNKDDQGNYMIDQDGKIFRHVLNFMRYGELELPEGFSELGLLKRQADFFLLQTLKESIERYVSIGGSDSIGLLFYDGKLFNTTTETLSKENSFFTKMLKGEVAVSRDSQGNFVMDRDGSVFHHVLNYLRDGGVFNAVTPIELDLLETDAKYFGLKVFSAHIKSIRCMQAKHLMSCTQLHVYFSQNTPCMAYVSYNSKSSRASKLPHVNALSPLTIINVLFKKTFTIIDAVKSGVVNTDKINPNGPTGVHDVMDYFIKGVRPQNIPEHEIKNNCIELVFYT